MINRQWAVPAPPWGNTHETAYVEHGKLWAWVDRKLVSLVLSCWKAGITTLFSCEEADPGIAFICFKESISMGGFVKIVSAAQVDRTIFEDLDKKRIGFHHKAEYIRGYNGIDLPVWTRNDGLLFPAAYIPDYTKVLQENAIA